MSNQSARRRAAFLLAAAGIVFPAFAQSENMITAIQITGLKRTLPRTAEEPLRRFIGMDAAQLDTNHVKAAVLDQGVLEPVAVTIGDNAGGAGKILIVEVREKWAIFPIPVFFAGSSGISGGIALFDANAFGMNHKMGLVGMYQSEGWIAMATYTAPASGSGHFGWSANVFLSEGERRRSNANDETQRRFNIHSTAARAALHYKITNTLNTALHASYTTITILDSGNTAGELDAGTRTIRTGPELSLRKTSWDGYLLSEESAAFSYHFIHDLNASSWHSFSLHGIFEKPVIPGFRVSIRGGGLSRPQAPALLESGPGESGVNILPGAFSAQHYAGLSLGLEKYLYRISAGTLSILSAWQMVYSNGPLMGGRFDYGVIGSLRFYMSRLAIPAVGFGAAYNIPADYFQFSFSIGMML